MHSKGAIFTFDIAWSPAATNCLDGRCYPVKKIAQVIDYLIIMGYDAEEDWWGGNSWGHSTDAFYRIKQGLREYVDCLRLPPNKMVLAFPWYGWSSQCDNKQPTQEQKPRDRQYQCQLQMFRNREHIHFGPALQKYFDYENRVDSQGQSLSQNYTAFYNDVENSYNFFWKDPNDPLGRKIYEIFIDAIPENYSQLHYRYQELVANSGVAGIGLFNSDHLDYASGDARVQEFNQQVWSIFNEYGGKISPAEKSIFPDDYWMKQVCRKFRDRTPKYGWF